MPDVPENPGVPATTLTKPEKARLDHEGFLLLEGLRARVDELLHMLERPDDALD